MNDPDIHDPHISDNLRRIVPDDLSTLGLVDGARRKRNQRKAGVGAVAALALVALAVPVALSIQGNSIIAQPANTTSSTPDARQTDSTLPGAAACYNDDGTPISWTQGDGEAAPAEPGAVRAWFCGDYSPETGQGFVGPLEPLTSGLDVLVQDVQAAEEIDLTVTTCMSDYNLSFNVVLEYPDGSHRIIGGDRHGCRTTYDGGIARAGAEEFYDALHTAWEKQRETDTGDWVVPTICPGPLSLFEMEPWDAVQGALCGEGADGSRSATYLSDDLLTEVTDSMQATLQSPGEDTPQPQSSAPEQPVWLTLSNTFTDYLTMVRHEDGLYRAHDGEGLEWFWEPSEALSAKLDAALEQADATDAPPAGQPVGPAVTEEPGQPAEPDPSTETPQPFVPQGCKSASTGDLVSTDLPGGALPEDAERVWLCANGGTQFGAPVPPMEPLEDPGLVSQAAAAFNDLAPMQADQPCTMELGASYLAVHEYADGARYAVELQHYGCRSVIAGATVKENSELYTAKLLDLWLQQRRNQGTIQTRPGPLCGLPSSMFVLLPEDATFTSATACVGSADADGIDLLVPDETPVPEELMGQIAAQLGAAPLDDADGMGPDGNSLVLLTEGGDPFVVSHQDDGTFYWLEGEHARVWTPAGGAAETLTALFEE